MGLSCNRATQNLNQIIKPFEYPLVYMVTPMVPFTKTIIKVYNQNMKAMVTWDA